MSRNTPKKETILKDTLWELDGLSIEEAVDYLQAIQSTHKAAYENIRLDLNWDSPAEDYRLQVEGYPIKTEEEKQKELAAKQAKAQKALDKLLLEAKENGFSLKGNIESL